MQPAVDRFRALEDSERELFREKLYSFGRFLLPHLPVVGDVSIVNPGDDIALRYYRPERAPSRVIDLDTEDAAEVKSPTGVGTGKAIDEDAPLSNIIGVLNDRFGTGFGEEDRLFFEQIKEKAVADGQIVQAAEANPITSSNWASGREYRP